MKYTRAFTPLQWLRVGTFSALLLEHGVRLRVARSRYATPSPLVPSGPPSMSSAGGSAFDVPAALAEHGSALFAFALNALGDRAEAEDCVQEAFVRASRDREHYDSSTGSVGTWLFAITRNLVSDALRARRPVPSDAEQIEDIEEIEQASEAVIEDALFEERLALCEFLATLPVEQREVITAVQLDGLSCHELSDRTGVPVATLRTRMYSGLRSLQPAPGGHGAG